jgi:hypothetical protein
MRQPCTRRRPDNHQLSEAELNTALMTGHGCFAFFNRGFTVI